MEYLRLRDMLGGRSAPSEDLRRDASFGLTRCVLRARDEGLDVLDFLREAAWSGGDFGQDG